MTGEYKRIVSKLKAGEFCTTDEIRRIMTANRDLFGQAVQVVDPHTRELREEIKFDVYRFSDSELYQLLKRNSRLEKGER